MNAAKKITISTLRDRKKQGEKFAMLTCYDCPTAGLMAEAGLDAILVGDTYAEVCLGNKSTLPAKMDTMIEVTAAVRRGAPNAFLLGDMPYLSYQANNTEAIHNAGRFMAEAGCDAVKLEVDRRLADTVAALTRDTVPVCAHLGLKP
ncbi:MAG: 3-methyl-2-oxobutanoate hydroxymethyltransferase, partial [Planctomycetes bacterium]|nr:3-methyl-2-oxobutanoate hydroxymethyltransferase [Planctomycetota bacterium]